MTLLKVIYQHERFLVKQHHKLLRILVLFMLLGAHWFYSDVFPTHSGAGPQTHAHLLSLLMLFSLPLLALVGFGFDRQSGSLAFMQSQPVDEGVWYAGRFLAWWRTLLPLAGLTLLWHLLALRWFLLDAGMVVASLLELALVSGWTLSLVLWCSSVARKPWLAVLGAFGVVLGFLFSITLELGLAQSYPQLAQWVRLFSFLHRTEALRMGLLSLGDVWFWLGGSVVLAHATVVRLKNSRGGRQRLYWPGLWLGVLVAFQAWPVEVDITAARAYRPSKAFKEQEAKAHEPLIITRYLSPALRFHADQQRLSRLLKAYGRWGSSVFVRTVFIDDEDEAKRYGLRELNPDREAHEDALFAGLFATYQTQAVFEPLITQINALDTALVIMLRRLLGEVPRVVLFTDDTMSAPDFSFLRASLGREFALSFYAEQFNDWGDPLSLHELPAEAYVVLSDGAITADMAADLWRFSQQGKGLLINTTQVITPLTEGAIPQRLPPTPLQQQLKREGLEVSSDLVLDPDGLFLHRGGAYGAAVSQPYRPWVVGRRAQRHGIFQTALGINPLFSVPLFATTNQWQPWLNSSPATYLQHGVVDLSSTSLQGKALQDGTGPHTIGMVRLGAEGSGTVLVLGSNVWVSDLVEAANAWDNLEGFRQALRHLSGASLLAQAQARFYPFLHQRKPYALQEDAFAVAWRTSLALLSVVGWAVVTAIKGRRE